MAPPSRSRTTAAEEILRLREENKKKDEQIADLLLKGERAAVKRKPLRKIPRPDGQAGRSSGYNLQTEMGLADNGDRYHRLFRMVKDHTHQFLAVKDTISKQSKVQVDAALAQIAKAAPYFARFEGYWPARDMITSYLLNMQTRRNKDLQLEAEASLQDRNTAKAASRRSNRAVSDGNNNNTDDPVPKRDLKRSIKRRANFIIHSDDADSEEEFETKSRKNKRKERTPTCSEDENSDNEPPTKVKRTTAAPVGSADEIKSRKRKRKQDASVYSEKEHSADELETKPSMRKPKQDAHVELPAEKKMKLTHPESAERQSELKWRDLPFNCIRCPEILPLDPDPRILAMFNKRERLVGEGGPGVPLLELQICTAITQEKERQRHLNLGEQNGWPREIDLENLPDRILEFKEEVADMLTDPVFLEESAAWKKFIKGIDYKLFHFCRSDCKDGFIYAAYARRCGYYGPKGADIINSTLMDEMFAKNIDDVCNTLCETLNDIVIASGAFFDSYDPTSNLLEIEDFTSFILAPFVAALLIAQDKNVEFEEAVDICDNSCDFGDIFQAEEEFKWHEEAQNVKVEKKIKSEPREKTKKEPKAKPAAKPKQHDKKQTVMRPKSNAVQSSYGTRSKARN
ncbi:hypothetical protein C8F04DRAFT_1267404 [Mycena alexandri]|uniref:Restriction of telomere capping protein 4 n=1 Tax=Mycena alexandri TaxID=1745969 RepID=A0AAD6RYN8_9AGAR|nr:hypothetical protein C8F04DRAFT_1280217 [Mycena alexandri]KAJ7027113.1 hypothetical protein C8F04DRAFT_1267404 [Mycena alexandri]